MFADEWKTVTVSAMTVYVHLYIQLPYYLNDLHWKDSVWLVVAGRPPLGWWLDSQCKRAPAPHRLRSFTANQHYSFRWTSHLSVCSSSSRVPVCFDKLSICFCNPWLNRARMWKPHLLLQSALALWDFTVFWNLMLVIFLICLYYCSDDIWFALTLRISFQIVTSQVVQAPHIAHTIIEAEGCPIDISSLIRLQLGTHVADMSQNGNVG